MPQTKIKNFFTQKRPLKRLKKFSEFSESEIEKRRKQAEIRYCQPQSGDISILICPNIKEYQHFPAVKKLEQEDPKGKEILESLCKLCEGVYYDEKHSQFVAQRIVELSQLRKLSINTPLYNSVQTLLCQVVLTKRVLLIPILAQIKHIDMNAPNAFKETPLEIAINQNDLKSVKALVDNGADIEKGYVYACGHKKQELIHLLYSKLNNIHADIWFETIRGGDVLALEEMIKKIDINQLDSKKQNALHYVCAANDTKVALFLLAQDNIDLELKDKNGVTPIELALRQEVLEPDIIDQFIEKKVNINSEYTLRVPKRVEHSEERQSYQFKKATLLHIMAHRGEYRLVKRILKNDAVNINITDAEGKTALHHAVLTENIRVITLLIKNPQIDLTIADKDGETAVDLAVNEEIKKLIEAEITNRKTNAVYYQRPYGRFWVKDITLEYSSRYTDKCISIPPNKGNELLRLRALLAKQKGFSKSNYLTASLTFIVVKFPTKASSERERSLVTVDIIPPKSLTAIQDVAGEHFLENVFHRFDSAPTEVTKSFIQYKNKIQSLSNKKDPEFYKRIHHSETTLVEFIELETTVQKLVDDFIRNTSLFYDIKIASIIILDIFSTNQTCKDCLIALLGEQNPQQSKFLQLLKKELESRKVILPKSKSLQLIIRVNFDHTYQLHEHPPILAHIPIDLHFFNGKWIVEHDASSDADQCSAFVSSKPH